MSKRKVQDENSIFKYENVGKSKPRKKRTNKAKKEIVTKESAVGQYVHPNDKRKNNPPVGMVDPNNDPDQPSKRYAYDPRLDPHLKWSGKLENSEFDIDSVSLHIHERIDPLTIIEKVMDCKTNVQQNLYHYFELDENNPPLRHAIEFYKHEQNWSNRLIAGDSLLVMNSLLEKEGMEGQTQMIYIDPPYGIKYGSNFQPFTNKTGVIDKKDDDLTQEPEMIKAFRDTWELGIHSYLTYLNQRLVLSKKMLKDSGSIFVQISDQNIHLIRQLLDEIFGSKNFVMQIAYRTSGSLGGAGGGGQKINAVCDYILWYAKDIKKTKFRRLFIPREKNYSWVKLENGDKRKLTDKEKTDHSLLPKKSQIFTTENLVSSGYTPSCTFEIDFEGKKYNPKSGKSWKTHKTGIEVLKEKGRLIASGKTLRYVMLYDDYPVMGLTNMWNDLAGATDKVYAVQTNEKVIQRCMLLCTDPGDLVFDPTCGGGTTAYVAEKYGRRWITCDSSRVAITIAKQRLVTAMFDYFILAHENEGVSGGFKYRIVPHVTLGSIANNEPPGEEKMFDRPIINKEKTRVSGPFTVEAVPSPTVKSIDVLSKPSKNHEETKLTTQQEWRDELLRVGIRGKGGQKIEFSRVQSHPSTKWLHVDAETKEASPKRVMVSFGPEYSPLEQRQVAKAISEAQTLIPQPSMIIFAALHFDPEAAKDIDELKWEGITILKAEMNKDLQTSDLKKKQTSNESFWLMGSPDVECKKQKDGKYIVRVNGFDYYNTKTDEIESGGASKIAIWELDTDYDDRSVYPQQVFFPIDGKSGGWNKLAKTLGVHVNDDLMDKFQGTESIPFDAGMNKRIAVKIIDDRGIESLKIIDLE